MDTNYTRIYIGNIAEAQSIVSRLKDIGIIAVVKDEAESARLAGFASSMLGEAEVFVHNDELQEAEKVLDS
ncbi:putative signal transducing protein [Maribacter sp. 2308TA10-17]|uniref:putative signal transducing protein n=1 Tax=Maribacter sp. 2308TA10-17 TaxID=3386276 RepID=UPI0039BCD628